LNTADLASRLDRLESHQAVERLIANYARGFDQRDPQLFASIWFHDSVLDMGEVFGRCQGLEEIAAGAERLWTGTPHMHHWMANEVIDINGDTATAISSLDCLVTDASAGPTQISGTYFDSCERREGRWGIVYRRFEMHYWTPLPCWVPREGLEAHPAE
jgi:hypothetical protein